MGLWDFRSQLESWRVAREQPCFWPGNPCSNLTHQQTLLLSMAGVDLGQPKFLVVKDTTLSLEPLDYISFWEFLTVMAFVMFSNSGLRDTDHPLGISVPWGNFWINLQNPFQKMDTKLREMPPPLFFWWFLLSRLSCSSVLLLWGIAILCLKSLETLVLSSFCSFPDIAQLTVSSGLLFTLPKVPLFQVVFYDAGWEGLKHLSFSHWGQWGGLHRPMTSIW